MGVHGDHAVAVAVVDALAFLTALDGSCRSPIAGHATLGPGGVTLTGQVASPDGRRFFDGVKTGPDAHAVGRKLGERIKTQLPADIFAVG